MEDFPSLNGGPLRVPSDLPLPKEVVRNPQVSVNETGITQPPIESLFHHKLDQ